MRPRHYAGESVAVPPHVRAPCGRFNEAPALRRGKSRSMGSTMRGRAGFNEAPALRRGKSVGRPDMGFSLSAASMRPRHYAGESDAMMTLYEAVRGQLQ